MFSLVRCLLLFVAAAVISLPVFSQTPPNGFQSDVETAKKPWTHLDFYNDPMNFQFAIISDRTGGMRPGVFADGIRKLNLLMPEFVMSVGDFIPGNTSDPTQLEREWAEFDAVLEPLKVPFFFVPGNHDINNDVMREVWMERSGVPFYSFVYKDVLFLALDSTGEKGDIIPQYQVDYMKETLNTHRDVRWTFVFLHHPLWLYDNPGNFPAIQELVKGRQHTVIAGHAHQYLYEHRNNANYYILATTGGGSRLRGTRFGEFDHVTWVTMTDEGPVMANLRLDGILPHDVTTREDYELTGALLDATELPYTLLTDGEEAVQAGTLYLTLRNPSKHDLKIDAKFMHAHEVTLEPAAIKTTLAPESEQVVEIAISASAPQSTEQPALLQLDWTMGFDLADQEDLYLSGAKNVPLRPSSAELFRTVAPEFVGSIEVALADSEPGYTIHYTTGGATPEPSDPAYEAPIAIDTATTLKARRFNEHGHGTATATQSYKPVPAGTGLRYRIYEGSWIRMPDYSNLQPVFESVATNLDVESRQMWADNWGMVLEGELEIETPGEYTFHLNSDDGSMLYIDDKLIINNDGDHSLLELSGSANLTAGKHDLRIEFFEAGGEAILELDMEGPGMERQPMPFARVSH